MKGIPGRWSSIFIKLLTDDGNRGLYLPRSTKESAACEGEGSKSLSVKKETIISRFVFIGVLF